MPTATQFSTKGLRNGFPFCLRKVDVSGFDRWSTLGGYTKDSVGAVTQSQIIDSLVNAAKLYWTAFSMTVGLVETSGGVAGTEQEFSVDADNDLVAGAAQPRERACGDGMAISDTDLTNDGRNLDSFLEIDNTNTDPIVRMYDGATTDEGNFVGYGIDENGSQPTRIQTGISGSLSVFVSLFSYGFITLEGLGESVDNQYITIDGIPFNCEAYALSTTNPSGQTVDASNLTAEAIDSSGDGMQVQIKGLGFYT